jgi:5'-nucleotidase
MNSASKPRLKRVLVTNDDGIEAPGLKVAEEVAASIAEEVWTVAPAGDFSGGSRVLSLHQALRLNQHGERRFALTGSPADCMFVGIASVLKDNPPDLVLSGVNAGVNIGGDVGFSGTVGAAMTAQGLGIPAMALSQAWKGDRATIPWETSRRWLPKVVAALVEAEDWPWPFVPNINIPATDPDSVTGIEVTQQGHSAVIMPTVEKRVDLRGLAYFWIYMHKENDNPKPNEDIAALRRDAVSVTPLGTNITDAGGGEILRRIFGTS